MNTDPSSLEIIPKECSPLTAGVVVLKLSAVLPNVIVPLLAFTIPFVYPVTVPPITFICPWLLL